ncbi:alpha/beta fold hydrolase [candidate division CSSED10-310 bacterium]|uniref:Alpha/beta fold hydrolase n=1 Tax=candidate division CSSED10-310 bacterium TaxID=2855610 RepID=A0ABV6YSL9_UNCC1
MFITINGAKIYYVIAGQGKPVLTLHGGPGIGDMGDNKKMFSSIEDKFKFIYYDQRGNGLSEQSDPETYTHEQYVHDAESLRQNLGFAKLALSGGSYGGIIALEYALRFPDSLTCMVLRGTAASYALQQAAFDNALQKDIPGVDQSLLEDLFFGRMKDDEDLKNKFLKIYPLYSLNYDPDKVKEFVARKKFVAATHNAFFTREFPRYDIRDRLGEISTPTLIMAGRYDWITPLKFARELKAGIPNSHLEIFENAGHSIHSDEPEKFYKVVNEYLETYG